MQAFNDLGICSRSSNVLPFLCDLSESLKNSYHDLKMDITLNITNDRTDGAKQDQAASIHVQAYFPPESSQKGATDVIMCSPSGLTEIEFFSIAQSIFCMSKDGSNL